MVPEPPAGSRYAEKKRIKRLETFGLDERGLQDILFKSLDRLLPDDGLLLLMQSGVGHQGRHSLHVFRVVVVAAGFESAQSSQGGGGEHLNL